MTEKQWKEMTVSERQEYVQKKEKSESLIAYLPPAMVKFFDLDSDELLDEKIQVLNELKKGTPIEKIPNFYNILELLPDGGIWD